MYAGLVQPFGFRLKAGRTVDQMFLNSFCQSLGNSEQSLSLSSLALRYPVAYNMVMIEIRQTEVYARWFQRLRDRQARVRSTTALEGSPWATQET